MNIEKTIKNLESNNVKCIFINDKKDIIAEVDKIIKDKSIVGIGGSTTLNNLGFIDHLRNRDIDFLDRYKPNLNSDQLKEVFRKSFFADYYITGTNAITEDGEFFNIDGRGNRVAAMIYGPDHVIIVAGINKLVKDLDEAIERCKKYAGPLNAKRLNMSTPCVTSGECVDCDCESRICRDYVLIKKPQPDRFTLILVNENLGF